jgi:hypothetical protein
VRDDYNWSDQQLNYLEHHRLWHIQARLSAGFWYDDNVNATDVVGPNGAGSYFNARPSVDVTYGPNSWGLGASLSYAADYRGYTKSEISDEFNQTASLNLTWTGSRTRAYLSTGYSDNDGGNVDIGERTQQTVMSLNTGFTYDITAKTSIGVAFTTELLDYSEGFFASNSYQVSAFADYKVTPKTSIGLGVAYGLTEVPEGTDYNTYDVNVRFNWSASDRLTVGLTAGAETVDSTAGDYSDVTPVFTFNFDYDLFGDGKTSAKIGAYRNFHPSAQLANQAYWSNGVFLSVSRQFGARTSVAMDVGYEYASYEATAAGITATRVDKLIYFRPSVTYAISTRISLSMFYEFSKDDSTGNGESSFERNSLGLMANFVF